MACKHWQADPTDAPPGAISSDGLVNTLCAAGCGLVVAVAAAGSNLHRIQRTTASTRWTFLSHVGFPPGGPRRRWLLSYLRRPPQSSAEAQRQRYQVKNDVPSLSPWVPSCGERKYARRTQLRRLFKGSTSFWLNLECRGHMCGKGQLHSRRSMAPIPVPWWTGGWDSRCGGGS
jgi:hypothetical protein